VTGFDKIEHASRTDVGVRRSHNQDERAVTPAGDPDRFREVGHLFMVADGMGGHAVGEKASAKAVRDIPHTYQKYAQEGAAQAIRKAFLEANAGIHAVGQENPEFRGMGTTATALIIRPEGAWIGHVGDSRAYRIRGGVIEQLTFDHSAVWEIARRQQVNPEELQGIRSNVILRSLGPDPVVEVDVEGPHPVRPGDVYVVCSDGLTGSVSDYEIGAVAVTLPAAEACDFLVELANLRGGPDNITVIVARVGQVDGATSAEAGGRGPDRARPRRPLPWPLTTLLVGIVLALVSLVMMTSNVTGGREAFVLAAAAIGLGLFGLGLHGHRPPEDEPDDDGPKLRIYRTTRCKIERPLLEKLIKAEAAVQQRLQELQAGAVDPQAVAHREEAEKLLARGDLDAAFGEHCRAMYRLIKSFNRQRVKEEVFQPVWDKHIAD
jgi:protein phosphatase